MSSDQVYAIKPILLSPNPDLVGDSALVLMHPTGRCVGFVADAPTMPRGSPQDTATRILELFCEEAAHVPLECDAPDGAGCVTEIFDKINVRLHQLHAAYQACFLCFYRSSEGIFAGAVGDVSLVLLGPDVQIRVTNPDPNDSYGARTMRSLSPMPESSSHSWRIGQMDASYPREAVLYFPSEDINRIALFSDGVEKHIPDFEMRLATSDVTTQEEFKRLLHHSARLPIQPKDLKDDVCVLRLELPAISCPEFSELPPSSDPTVAEHLPIDESENPAASLEDTRNPADSELLQAIEALRYDLATVSNALAVRSPMRRMYWLFCVILILLLASVGLAIWSCIFISHWAEQTAKLVDLHLTTTLKSNSGPAPASSGAAGQTPASEDARAVPGQSELQVTRSAGKIDVERK